jgi:peptidoglycan-associated lipoprotein
MTPTTRILVTCGIASILISGCSGYNKVLDIKNTMLNRDAGFKTDEGGFGNPTLNNTLAQAAYSNQDGLMLDLSRKFAKDVPNMINFAFGSSRLDSEAKETLARQANWIKQFPEVRFRVYGHTDLVGGASYNKRLGYRRAKNSVNFMIANGVDPDNVEAVASFGETQPLVATQDRNRENRRTVTEVIGFSRNFVGDDLDGQYAVLVYRAYVGSASAAETSLITSP